MVLRLAGCDRDDIKNDLYSSALLLSVGIKAAKLGPQFEEGLRLVKDYASKLLLNTATIKLKVTCLLRFQYLNSSSSLRKRITVDSR